MCHLSPSDYDRRVVHVLGRIAADSLGRLFLRIAPYSQPLPTRRSSRCMLPWSVWHHRVLPNPGYRSPPVVSRPLPSIHHYGWPPLPHAICPLRTQMRYDTCSAVSYLHHVGTVPSGGCLYVKTHAHTHAVYVNIYVHNAQLNHMSAACVYTHIYILYIYIYREREREREILFSLCKGTIA